MAWRSHVWRFSGCDIVLYGLYVLYTQRFPANPCHPWTCVFRKTFLKERQERFLDLVAGGAATLKFLTPQEGGRGKARSGEEPAASGLWPPRPRRPQEGAETHRPPPRGAPRGSLRSGAGEDAAPDGRSEIEPFWLPLAAGTPFPSRDSARGLRPRALSALRPLGGPPRKGNTPAADRRRSKGPPGDGSGVRARDPGRPRPSALPASCLARK